MAGRLRQVTELYETELQRITAERAEWMGFLRFAAAHYQYSFDQQLLLYAQRPEATVVLPMEDWNMRYGRWVARGAKAIAVFDENYSSRRQLRFLFDIADTVETNQTRPIPRFEVLPDERPGIVDALEGSVGELAERDSFEQALFSVAQNVVRERMPEIMREVLVSLDGSVLENCTDEEIENVFSTAVAESVGFVLLTKCGCEPERVIGEDAFAALPVLDTPLLGTALGTAVSDISRDILVEIVHIQRSLKTREFASEKRELYNTFIEETPHDRDNMDAQERSEEHGDHLHDAERVSALGSVCEQMDMEERLHVLHDFFRAGNEVNYAFDYRDALKKGHHFADYVCPESMEQHADHLMLGEKYARVLYLQSYPAYMRDDLIKELMELPRNLMLSIDYIPVPTDEAVKTVENKLLGVETNIANWQRKQNQNNNFSAAIPYDLNQQRQEANEFLDDLTTRDQRMLHMVLTLVHMADSREELDADTRTLVSTGNKLAYHFSTLRYQQLEGLNTALPYGLRKIDTLRTITTDPAATLTPFHAQEIAHKDGIYHGLSPVSKNMIFINRRQLMNGNGCILGVSGSGKSFFGKLEIVPLLLRGGVDILILDPEREYTSLVEQLGGEVVHISASSPQHINVMDMVRGYGDEANPLVMKSEFILSMFEVLYKQRQALSIRDMSLIDRCVRSVYQDYLRSDYTLQPPTLHDLYNELCAQPEPEGQRIALDVEMFVKGSLNTFAQQTNVDLNSALIAFDIRELDSTLLPLGMLVVLDAIYNRLLRNQQQGRETWIFVDEAYLLFQYPYSANFFYKLWKRIRKQNGFATAITQNVEELLKSDTARLMLANSEYLVLLNQADSDQEELARLLKIPAEQLSYVDNVPQGHGLLKCGSHIVPFEDHFPTHTRLYRMMTTKPNEKFLYMESDGETS